MIEGKCPDCGYKKGVLNPITILTMDDEVVERELQCPRCGHVWIQRPDENSKQISLRRVTV